MADPRTLIKQAGGKVLETIAGVKDRITGDHAQEDGNGRSEPKPVSERPAFAPVEEPASTRTAPLPSTQADPEHKSPERYSDMTLAELRTLAAERDIDGRSSMSKTELARALGAWKGGSESRTAGTSFEDMTVDELRTLAAERDVKGRSSMRKSELVKALRAQ